VGVSVGTSFSSGNFVSFGVPQQVLTAFGTGANAGGWTSQNLFPRELADVNGDGRADIVAFGQSGVFVALANGAGSFNAANLVFQGFGASAGGWTSQDRYPRELADVNGDG